MYKKNKLKRFELIILRSYAKVDLSKINNNRNAFENIIENKIFNTSIYSKDIINNKMTPGCAYYGEDNDDIYEIESDVRFSIKLPDTE